MDRRDFLKTAALAVAAFSAARPVLALAPAPAAIPVSEATGQLGESSWSLDSWGECWVRSPYQTNIPGSNTNLWPGLTKVTLRDEWICYAK